MDSQKALCLCFFYDLSRYMTFTLWQILDTTPISCVINSSDIPRRSFRSRIKCRSVPESLHPALLSAHPLSEVSAHTQGHGNHNSLLHSSGKLEWIFLSCTLPDPEFRSFSTSEAPFPPLLLESCYAESILLKSGSPLYEPDSMNARSLKNNGDLVPRISRIRKSGLQEVSPPQTILPHYVLLYHGLSNAESTATSHSFLIRIPLQFL